MIERWWEERRKKRQESSLFIEHLKKDVVVYENLNLTQRHTRVTI